MKGGFSDPAVVAKARATRERKKAERLAAERAPAEGPPSLADLGFAAEPEDSFGYVLSADERRRIEAEARAQVEAEEKAKLVRAFKAEMLDQARRRTGTMPEDEERNRYLEERVQIRIVLPSLRTPTGRELPPDPIILDQRVFHHGTTHWVSRAQAEYIESLMNQARMYMAQVDGRSRTYYNEQLGTMMWHGHGVAQGGTSGASFDAIHRRPA